MSSYAYPGPSISRDEAGCREHKDELVQMLARQTSFAMALFGEDMRPVFVNGVLRALLELPTKSAPLPQLSIRLKTDDVEHPMEVALGDAAEWSGEIEIYREDRSNWHLTVRGSVTRFATDDGGVRYGLIAQRSGGLPNRFASRLSKREREVLDAMTGGATSKKIAQSFGISHRTVEAHRCKIMHKLNAKSLPDLFQKIVLENFRI